MTSTPTYGLLFALVLTGAVIVGAIADPLGTDAAFSDSEEVDVVMTVAQGDQSAETTNTVATATETEIGSENSSSSATETTTTATEFNNSTETTTTQTESTQTETTSSTGTETTATETDTSESINAGFDGFGQPAASETGRSGMFQTHGTELSAATSMGKGD